ncbi:MAG: hypothetical protein Kow0090_18790 [Myxococcota bacterium]
MVAEGSRPDNEPVYESPKEVQELIHQSQECVAELNYSCAKLAYELALEKLAKLRQELDPKSGSEVKAQLDKEEAKILFMLGVTLSFLGIEPDSAARLEAAFFMDPELEYDAQSFSPSLRAKIEAAKEKARVKRLEAAKEEELHSSVVAKEEGHKSEELISQPPAVSLKAPHTIFVSGGGSHLFWGQDSTYFRKGFYSRGGYRYLFDFGFTPGGEISFLWLSAGDVGELFGGALSATGGYSYRFKGLELTAIGNVGYALLHKATGSDESIGTMLFGVRGVFGGRFPKWLYYGVSLGPQWYFFSNAYSSVIASQIEVGATF